MLVTMKEILDVANVNSYGVAAPNVNTELDARAVFEAAEELNAPIIIDVATDANPDVEFLCWMLRKMAGASKIPVALNMDHTRTFEQAISGIRYGFTSIMIDRSMLPYEKNLEEVKVLTKIAHDCGVSVEAELGQVGLACNYEKDRDAALTDPKLAFDFIEKTGVDCLAVAVGNAHGAYSGHVPYLDFERLKSIKEITNKPLVLHGGSGTGNAQLQKACLNGINKVNVSNDLLRSVCDALHDADFTGNKAYSVWEIAKQAYKEKLKELIVLFGSADKAWQIEPKGFVSKKYNDFCFK